ncbi:hypothetical protein MLD38_013275 [Melastoma candidum]|uniref:Uncharacterized protein n=1 Tax=Melastoma candidum TaxID=119954 RepID=A0ACB9RAW9_9MYRT|nr:hypothetical protein MLD38_013275 [Melastoma candidum]
MGCAASCKKKNPSIPEVAVFASPITVPAHSERLQKSLKGLFPPQLLSRLSLLRDRIRCLAEDPSESAIDELREALQEYLPVAVGLTTQECGLGREVEFKWNKLGEGRQETGRANPWFELLCVIHAMAMTTLWKANSMMIPKVQPGSDTRTISAECKRDSVDLLLKASGFLEFCITRVLLHAQPETTKRLPIDLQAEVLRAISIQALGQGTEIQLGLAVESQKASLSVKRRLACEQLSYFSQAHGCLSEGERSHGHGKKLLLFCKWKYLEAKAAAYYYHGLIVDKGNEPTCHMSSFCCFLAAQELLSESKKACLSFCLADPVCRIPPLWGAMKYLYQKIPEVASRKSQMYGYLLEQEKGLHTLPDLPEFPLSLSPEEYQLPEVDPSWDQTMWEEVEVQKLKDHLKDHEDDND